MPGHCFKCDKPTNNYYCDECNPLEIDHRKDEITIVRAEYDRLLSTEGEYQRLRASYAVLKAENVRMATALDQVAQRSEARLITPSEEQKS